MFNTLKDAFMDPKFHKDLIQKVALSVIVATVTAVVQQGAGVVVAEVRTKIEEVRAANAPTEEVA